MENFRTPMITDLTCAPRITGEPKRFEGKHNRKYRDRLDSALIVNNLFLDDEMECLLFDYLYQETRQVVIPASIGSPESVGIVSVMQIEAQELILESIIYIISEGKLLIGGFCGDPDLKDGFEFMFPVCKTYRKHYNYKKEISEYIYKSLSKEEIRQYTLCFFNENNLHIWQKLFLWNGDSHLEYDQIYDELFDSWLGRSLYNYNIPHKVFRLLNLIYNVKDKRQKLAYNIIVKSAFNTRTKLGKKMFDIRLKLDGLDEFYD